MAALQGEYFHLAEEALQEFVNSFRLRVGRKNSAEESFLAVDLVRKTCCPVSTTTPPVFGHGYHGGACIRALNLQDLQTLTRS